MLTQTTSRKHNLPRVPCTFPLPPTTPARARLRTHPTRTRARARGRTYTHTQRDREEPRVYNNTSLKYTCACMDMKSMRLRGPTDWECKYAKPHATSSSRSCPRKYQPSRRGAVTSRDNALARSPPSQSSVTTIIWPTSQEISSTLESSHQPVHNLKASSVQSFLPLIFYQGRVYNQGLSQETTVLQGHHVVRCTLLDDWKFFNRGWEEGREESETDMKWALNWKCSGYCDIDMYCDIDAHNVSRHCIATIYRAIHYRTRH